LSTSASKAAEAAGALLLAALIAGGAGAAAWSAGAPHADAGPALPSPGARTLVLGSSVSLADLLPDALCAGLQEPGCEGRAVQGSQPAHWLALLRESEARPARVLIAATPRMLARARLRTDEDIALLEAITDEPGLLRRATVGSPLRRRLGRGRLRLRDAALGAVAGALPRALGLGGALEAARIGLPAGPNDPQTQVPRPGAPGGPGRAGGPADREPEELPLHEGFLPDLVREVEDRGGALIVVLPPEPDAASGCGDPAVADGLRALGARVADARAAPVPAGAFRTRQHLHPAAAAAFSEALGAALRRGGPDLPCSALSGPG